MLSAFLSLSLSSSSARSVFVTSRGGAFERATAWIRHVSTTNKSQTSRKCLPCVCVVCFFSCVATSQRRATQNHSKGAKPTSRAVSNFPDRRRTFQTRRTTDKLHRCIFRTFASALDSFSVGAAGELFPPSGTPEWSRVGLDKGHRSLARCSVGHIVTGSRLSL